MTSGPKAISNGQMGHHLFTETMATTNQMISMAKKTVWKYGRGQPVVGMT